MLMLVLTIWPSKRSWIGARMSSIFVSAVVLVLFVKSYAKTLTVCLVAGNEDLGGRLERTTECASLPP